MRENDVDTSRVVKQPVHCFVCSENFYFTLRAIAESEKLRCPHCGCDINLAESLYRSLVAKVKQTMIAIGPQPLPR